ncbi:hypothetical protein D3C71_1671160 [compost metagenome]
MSDSKRWMHEINFEGGAMVETETLPDFCGSELYVLAQDFEAAQAKLAALREERDMQLRLMAAACDATGEKSGLVYQKLQDLILFKKEYDQRIEGTERRNAELVELLRDVKRYGTSSYCLGGYSVMERLDACLDKITELN